MKAVKNEPKQQSCGPENQNAKALCRAEGNLVD